MEAEVDETLIAAMLALTPEERLRQNDRTLAVIAELREGLGATARNCGEMAGTQQRVAPADNDGDERRTTGDGQPATGNGR